MNVLVETPANRQKAERLRRAMAELMVRALRQGFFGVVTLEMKVQDGTIQQIVSRVEQVEK